MKMDFPHPANTDPAGRSRARYSELVACAANAQLARLWRQADRQSDAQRPIRFDGLDARIGFFSKSGKRPENSVFGAFLPKSENVALVYGHDENGINRAASAIGKPNFLGSRYPGHPDSLRGMEN
jgi:hypothetical protein